MLEARKRRGSRRAVGDLDRLDGDRRRRIAAAGSRMSAFPIEWIVADAVIRQRLIRRRPANQIKVSRKAGPLVALEHAVGENILLRHVMVGLGFGIGGVAER